MKDGEIVEVNGVEEISLATGFSGKDIEVLKNTVFSTLKTQAQVILALNVAKKYNLDIFAKEFWAWVDGTGRLITIASASGFMKIARRQPGFISLQANAVYEGEEFSLNTGTGEVSHQIKLDCRGQDKRPLGAYARLKMEGKEDVVKWVDWHEYSNETTKFQSPWNKQRAAMIEKCGTTVLCREAFGLSGLYGEEETDQMRNLEIDVTNETDLSSVEETTDKIHKDILEGVVE